MCSGAGRPGAVTPPGLDGGMVATLTIVAVVAAAAVAYLLGSRAAGARSADALLAEAVAEQTAVMEARLNQEREHIVSAAASMAARMAGEKLGENMTASTRLLDLRATA